MMQRVKEHSSIKNFLRWKFFVLNFTRNRASSSLVILRLPFLFILKIFLLVKMRHYSTFKEPITEENCDCKSEVPESLIYTSKIWCQLCDCVHTSLITIVSLAKPQIETYNFLRRRQIDISRGVLSNLIKVITVFSKHFPVIRLIHHIRFLKKVVYLYSLVNIHFNE